METKKNCNNCAWFCHADGRCYGSWSGCSYEIPDVVKENGCRDWTADGLEDWEREDADALVTMDEVIA